MLEPRMTTQKAGSSDKGPSTGTTAAQVERTASNQQRTPAAPKEDWRRGNKHAGHDLDSGQHSTSGSRSR